MNRFYIIGFDDWEALYLEGYDLIWEGHSLSAWTIFHILKDREIDINTASLAYITAPDDLIEEVQESGNVPQKLEEIRNILKK